VPAGEQPLARAPGILAVLGYDRIIWEQIYLRVGRRAVLDAIRRIVQVLRESSRSAERRVGLSGAQLFVLQTLGEAPEISLNRLAALTHTHQSSVSTVITRLVSQGLVRRARSKRDGQTLELSLKAAGVRAAKGAPNAAQGRLIAAVDMLPSERRRLLAASLTEMASMLDGVNVPPAMFFEERTGRADRKKSVS
jgi:DNA-binding MarR family transcriptional regulator